MYGKSAILFLFVFLAARPVFARSDAVGLPYLGQNPPGDTPKVFAPGIISLNNRLETYPTFTPGGDEMYFSIVNQSWTTGTIFYTKLQNGSWTVPDTASFSKNRYINWESFLSPNGSKQFFASSRPPSSNMDIWMIKRVGDTAWSEPTRLNSPVNSNGEDGSACITNDGTMYFKSSRGGGINGSWLYRSRLIDTAYSQVESLGNIIKTTAKETEPFMAPDESYLIFISATRAGGRGGWDLWICCKKGDGSWTRPINMGPGINTALDEYGPRVTFDGKYLFFTRDNGSTSMDIYWVSAGIIDSLKHQNFAPFLNLQIPNQTIAAGQMYSYTFSDSTFIDDNGNNTLTYSASLSDGSPLPAWLTFNPITRTLTGIPAVANPLSIKITATDTAGAQAFCVFSVSIISGIPDDDISNPETIKLYQNFPNPFNPSTAIEFSISKGGRYNLCVYNPLGQLVKTISNREYGTGTHREYCSMEGLPSGVYFYRLRGNNVNAFSKMIFIQ